MSLPRRRFILLAILGISLLLRGATFVCFRDTVLPLFPEKATSTDMHATWQWTDRILAGDLLGRDTYHPEFEWMQVGGSPADWAQRWGDIHIFQQEPLYPYFVASLRWALPSPVYAIPLIQLLLGGLLLPLSVYALGRQLVGARTGLYAAAVAAVFGPGIFYQSALLRDWTIPIGSAFTLALVIAGIRRSRMTWLCGVGVLLGLGAMMKSTALLWLPVCFFWLWLVSRKSVGRVRALRGAAILTLGCAVGLAPLVVRNGLVGAPLLSLSNRLPEGLIQGNAADAYPVGLCHPDSQDATLKAAGGSALKVAGEILRGYVESSGDFFRVQGLKLCAALAPEDLADNLSYEYGEQQLWPLRFCLSWGLLLALALPGLFLLLVWRRRRAPWIAGILAANAIAILLPIALGRYRLESLPLLAIGAAQVLAVIVVAVRRRRWSRLAIQIGAVAAVAVLIHWMWPPSWLRWNARQSLQMMDRQIAMDIYAGQRRFEAAADEAAELARRAAKLPVARAEMVQARQDEVLCLIFGVIDATRSGNLPLAEKAFGRARVRVSAGIAERVFTRGELVAFLAQSFPRPMAEELAEVLLSTEPLQLSLF